jgi:hypothetical protein
VIGSKSQTMAEAKSQTMAEVIPDRHVHPKSLIALI